MACLAFLVSFRIRVSLLLCVISLFLLIVVIKGRNSRGKWGIFHSLIQFASPRVKWVIINSISSGLSPIFKSEREVVVKSDRSLSSKVREVLFSYSFMLFLGLKC
jgi:hypothetical protein